MITSLAYMILAGYALASVCRLIRLPRIIGMLVTGILLGPFVLDVLDPSILGISSELRRIALVIILIKAGLSLHPADLKKVGRPALLLSFLPACCELLGCVLLAPKLMHVTVIEAAVMGAVLAAVSPAVVVPRMVDLMEKKWGTGKSIPQLLLAGASLDDVFVIVLFTTFCGIAQGGEVSWQAFASVPVSVILGILLGVGAGWLLALFFEECHRRGCSVRNSMKVILVLGVSFLLLSAETWLENVVAVSGLLAVMAMACTVQLRCRPAVAADLSGKFGRLWVFAEIMLFVLVGAAVDIRYTLEAGLPAVALILLALVFRSGGVLLSLLGTGLNRKERLYCVIAYLPKATVQAAIGSVPLSLGLSCGNTVLSVAVVSILLTAPLGAIGMDLSYQRLLEKEE